MFSTAVVCASLIKEAGNEDQKKEYLTKIASGDITLAFALKNQADTLLLILKQLQKRMEIHTS